MIVKRTFEDFKILELPCIEIEKPSEEDEQQVDGIDLKIRFKLPQMFTFQIEGFYQKELKAYRFFVPKQYQQDPEKESEVRDKDNEKNIITF